MNLLRLKLLILVYLLLNFGLSFWLYSKNLLLQLNGDAVSWMQFAQKFHLSKDISQEIYWPPVYPFLVSSLLAFPNYLLLISLAQNILFVFILFIFYKTTALLGVRFSRKILGVAVFALVPSHLIITKLPLAETLFLAFYAIHFLFLCRYLVNLRFSNLFLSSVFLILTTFTKPTTLYLILFEVLLLLFLHRKRFRKLLVPITVYISIPLFFFLIWSSRNFYNTGVFTFAEVSNYNLLTHNFYHIFPLTHESSFKLGDEFRAVPGEKMGRYLIGPYLDKYIVQKNLPESQNVILRYKYAGDLATQKILQYWYLYFPVHFAESFYLFFPNIQELFKKIFPNLNIIILFTVTLSLGFSFLIIFFVSFISFIKASNFLKLSSFTTIQVAMLLQLIYLQIIIGPTSFGDGGRFSFVFLYFVLLFCVSSFPKLSSPAL